MVARPVRMRLQRKYPTVPDRRTTVHAANNKSTQTGIVIFCPNAFYPKLGKLAIFNCIPLISALATALPSNYDTP